MAQSNVVTNIESKTKATKHLSLKGVGFFVIYLLIAYILRGYVNSILLFPYMVFSAMMCAYLLMPSIHNKGRNNLESIYILIFSESSLYKPFYNDESKGERN